MTASKQVRRWTLVLRRDDDGVQNGWPGEPNGKQMPPDLVQVPVVSLSDAERALRNLYAPDPDDPYRDDETYCSLAAVTEALGIDLEEGKD